jgi:hypothetical protein
MKNNFRNLFLYNWRIACIWFEDKKFFTITILALILLLLLLLNLPYVRNWLIDCFRLNILFLQNNNSFILPITEFIKNLISIVAIIIGATWSYYLFIKGRTFNPRISISTKLRFICGEQKEIAVIRIKFRNRGRIKIRPLSAPVMCYYATFNIDSTPCYFKFFDIKNVLAGYLIERTKIILEPQDEITIDLPVTLTFRTNYREHQPFILLKAFFIDTNWKSWEEHTILNLEKAKD